MKMTKDNISLLNYLYTTTLNYFQDEVHRREFSKWYKEKYNREYDWKLERRAYENDKRTDNH